LPLPGGTPAERLLKHVEQAPPDVRVVNPAVPAGLIAVLEHMLAKNPADRYQTPLELLHDLENMERLNDLPAAREAPIPFAESRVAAPPPTVFAERTPPTGEFVPPRKLRAPHCPRASPRNAANALPGESAKPASEPAGSGPRRPWGPGLTAGVVVLLTHMQQHQKTMRIRR